MNKKLFVILLVLMALSTMLFLYGCGTTSTGGGSAGSPWIYVSDYDNNSIMVINGTTNATVEPIPLGFQPVNIAASPNGKRLYVSDDDDDTVTVVDTATNTTIDVFTVDNAARSLGMVVSPNGEYLYMTSATTTEFFKVSTTSPYTYQRVPLIGVGGRIALNSTGTKAYVCVPGPSMSTLTSLEVIDLQTMTKIASVDVINHPYDITIIGNYAYIAMSSLVKCVARVDLSTYAVETIERSPVTFHGIVSIPGKNKMYISNYITSPAEIYILRPENWPTLEATVISSSEMNYPQLMAATANYAYAVDAIPHNRIAVIDVNTDETVKFIYGLNGYLNYSSPVVVYK